jgi:uncharacterized membrane protein YdjX (TVP38/TMEM64 family)
MRRLFRFVMDMDARAWRSVVASFVLFGGVGLVFLFGASLLGLDGAAEVERWMGAGIQGPWSLPIAVISFAAFAFLGVPQFVLIAAAVVAFGPWAGFAYSWIGTLVSALVGFALGRRFGARALAQVGGEGLKRFMAMVGRNGLTASLIVRLVPSAPFIVVNMAAGVTPMRLRDFATGTAIGIVPKIALTAFAGASVVKALSGGGKQNWLALALAAALWLASALVARQWIRRREAQPTPNVED